MKKNIYEAILKIQSGDNDTLLKIIEKFAPLLKKYAFYLNYEDAYDELQLFFMEILMTIKLDNFRNLEDKVFLLYFKVSVKNKYIALSKSYNNYLKSHMLLGDSEEVILQTSKQYNSYEDDLSKVLFEDIKKVLSKIEFKVIYAIYYDNFSVVELSEMMNTSRQNINQAKKRAIDKLANHFKIGGD